MLIRNLLIFGIIRDSTEILNYEYISTLKDTKIEYGYYRVSMRRALLG